MESYKPRGYSVSDFVSWSDKNELVLQPKFQRRDVWTPKARSHLIDTVLRQLPIPIVFIRQDIDPQTRRTIREIVDGQQRLRAVIDYIAGKFPVSEIHSSEYPNMRFDELPKEVQRHFLNYEFSSVILIGATDAEVLNIFARLNSYTERLKPQELLNAEFSGVFKQLVYRLGLAHLTFWRENGILSDRQIVRMGEAEMASELVVAMIDGLQDGKASLRSFYKKFDDRFPEAQAREAEFDRILSAVGAIFGDQLRQTCFKRKAMFYSLFCALYDIRFGLRNSPTNKRGRTVKLTSAIQKELAAPLLELSRKFDAADPHVSELREAALSQTDRIAPRIVRHRFIWNAIVDVL